MEDSERFATANAFMVECLACGHRSPFLGAIVPGPTPRSGLACPAVRKPTNLPITARSPIPIHLSLSPLYFPHAQTLNNTRVRRREHNSPAHAYVDWFIRTLVSSTHQAGGCGAEKCTHPSCLSFCRLFDPRIRRGAAVRSTSGARTGPSASAASAPSSSSPSAASSSATTTGPREWRKFTWLAKTTTTTTTDRLCRYYHQLFRRLPIAPVFIQNPELMNLLA